MHILKHHANQLVNMAKSVAVCNIAVGIASTTMSEEQMRALHNELEPVLERITEELKAVVNKHGISFSGHGAALIGKAAFPTPENAAGIHRRGIGLI